MSNITLYNENCYDRLSKIPDKSVDLILTDPPYNTLSAAKKVWDTDLDLEKLFKEYWRVLKDEGVILLFADGGTFLKKIMNADKNYKYSLVWIKNTKANFLNAKKMPMTQYETINVFYKNPVYNPQLIKGKQHLQGSRIANTGAYNVTRDEPGRISDEYYPSNVLTFNTVPNGKGKLHNSQKPVDLLEWLIKSYSNDNAIVIDTFMGSGSTMVACINTNRDGIGIELNKDYFDTAKTRIEGAANEDTTIQ